MAINLGIVGLPNVGKSTLFNALSKAGAESQNFPFCTIEPNVGVVPVPDARLEALGKLYASKRTVPTSLEFVDIAGLVKGAASGEGLGNQFLGHIRAVHAIVHVVRCFEDEDVVHVDGSVHPVRDVEVIEAELLLKDLDTLEQRLQRQGKQTRAAGKAGEAARADAELLGRLKAHMETGAPAHTFARQEAEGPAIAELCLLTDKPTLFVGNVAESDASAPDGNPHFQALKALAASRKAPVIAISAAIEAELSQLADDERAEFLSGLGLAEAGLNKIIREGYALLGLITYLTAGPEESRAWTIPRNTRAPQAAGVIHSDFERGFIKAEVMRTDDLLSLGSEAAVRSAGKLRLEGKEYIVADGDVMHFRFNV